MSFSGLPNEILSEIISAISCEISSNKVLASMSICSRRLHNLIEPFLYSSFRETDYTTLLRFLRTILGSPHLALLVKSYEGRDARRYTYEKSLTLDIKDSGEQQDFGEMLFSAIIQGGISRGGSRIWREDILEGCWDAATGLAMLCLPNLRNFQVTVMSESRMVSRANNVLPENPQYDDVFDPMSYRWINRALRDAQKLQESGNTMSKKSMSKLDTVKLVLSDSHRGHVWVSNIFGFLGLKSLKTFDTKHIWLGQDVDTFKFSIANLRLDDCPDYLGLGVYYPPDFTQFKTIESFHFSPAPGNPFVFATLISSLSHMAPSLRELVVRGSRNDYPMRSCSEKASLNLFVVLEKLDITAPSLIVWLKIHPPIARPWNVALPQRLKRLIVRECVLSIVVEATNLMNRQQPYCHKLEVLNLEFLHDFPRDTAQEEVEILKELCLVAGVNFTVDWDGRQPE